MARAIYSISTTNTGMNAFNLIELGIRNIQHKKTRSIITIGGMAIGIGSIVFLLSLGYGVQKLVVNRVARLDELLQASVSSQPGSLVKINDAQLSKIKKFSGVSSILPLISVVGRVNYNNSVTDMAVYGVTTRYLSQSAEKPIRGRLFQSEELAHASSAKDIKRGEVAGALSTRLRGQIGDEIGTINYAIDPGAWVKVYENSSVGSKVLGLTKRTEGKNVATLVLGNSYKGSAYGSVLLYESDAEDTINAGKWLRHKFGLWEEKDCDQTNTDCDPSGKYRKLPDTSEESKQTFGYLPVVSVELFGNAIAKRNGEVLGVEDERTTGLVDLVSVADIKASGAALLSLTEIASESATVAATTKTVEVSASAWKLAVANRAMLSVLGLKEDEAVGKEFEVSFVASGELLDGGDLKVESVPSKYKIVGVVAQNSSPFFYVPFIDLRSLGINNYSQAKLIASSQSDLPKIRQMIEGLGFNTTSASDTVDQIDKLFYTVRLALVALGTIALCVAAMGMFNTLTVSLLERTHEVGLMKTMGMKSNEVEDLFIIESVFMGLAGGIVGILLGFAVGKAVSFVLTLLAIKGGAGVIDVSYIPSSLIFFIMMLSLVVGFATGVYPSQRAKRISALNALRYE
jgi:ABC-type antimicrobial peptide transport system permease subunit